jgi:phosphoribosylamine-glycine ligase
LFISKEGAQIESKQEWAKTLMQSAEHSTHRVFEEVFGDATNAPQAYPANGDELPLW